MNVSGSLVVYAAAAILFCYALSRRDASLKRGLQRASKQFIALVPRLIFSVIAAGFAVKLIPANVIGELLGEEAGFTAILIGSFAGLMVPFGPVISFSIAAALASQGASVPGLISFITGWSVFAAHRVFIFELPLLGPSFVRLRLASVMVLPLFAGTITLLAITLRKMLIP